MYYQRYLENKIFSPSSRGKVKLLLGPRQAGKSTMLKHGLANTGKLWDCEFRHLARVARRS